MRKGLTGQMQLPVVYLQNSLRGQRGGNEHTQAHKQQRDLFKNICKYGKS